LQIIEGDVDRPLDFAFGSLVRRPDIHMDQQRVFRSDARSPSLHRMHQSALNVFLS
jgi:hypothetical protein